MFKRFGLLVIVAVMLVVSCLSVSLAEEEVTDGENFWESHSEYYGEYNEDEYPDYMNSVIMDDPEYFLYWDEDVDPVDVVLTDDPIANESYFVTHEWHDREAKVVPVFGSNQLPCALEDLCNYFSVKDQILTLPAEQTEQYSWIPLFYVSSRCGSFLMPNEEHDSIAALTSKNCVLRIQDGIVALMDTFIYSGINDDFTEFVIDQLGSPKCVLVKESQVQKEGFGYSNYTLCYQYGDMWMLVEIAEDYSKADDMPCTQWMDEISFTYMNPENFMEWLGYDQILY